MLDWFIPDHTLAVYFGMSHFNQVLKEKNGQWEPMMLDIPQAKKDCDDLRVCLEKFNIKSEEQVYDLSNDPSSALVMEKLIEIKNKLIAGKEAKPPVNYLVIFFFAGHGILKDGGQHILFNEYFPRNKYYKTMPIESVIRDWASKFSNLYAIGMFACCRQLHNSKKMTDGVRYDESLIAENEAELLLAA